MSEVSTYESLKPGDTHRVPVQAAPYRVVLVPDNTLVSHISHPNVHVELTAIRAITRYREQAMTILEKDGEGSLTVTDAKFEGGTQMEDLGQIRFTPQGAADAAVALLAHIKKHSLMDQDELQAKIDKLKVDG